MSVIDHSQAPGAGAGAREDTRPDAALMALPGELRERLARLAGARDEDAEVAIATFDYGYRAVLESYDLITTSLPGTALPGRARKERPEVSDPRLRVNLTDLGRAVIAACAAPTSDSEEIAERAQQLHHRFMEELAFETEEASS